MLGQDWTTSPDGTVMQNLDTGDVFIQSDPTSAGGEWWTTLPSVLAPIASVVGSVVKAVTGQPSAALPPGYTRNPLTGQIVPTSLSGTYSTSASWLIPVALLGVGVVLLMRKK